MNALWYKKFYERLATSYQFSGYTAIEYAEELLCRIEVVDSLDADASSVAALLGKTRNRTYIMAALEHLCELDYGGVARTEDYLISENELTAIQALAYTTSVSEGGIYELYAEDTGLKAFLADLAYILRIDAADADLQLNVLGAVEYLADENQRYYQTCQRLRSLAGCRLDSELPDALSKALTALGNAPALGTSEPEFERASATLAVKAVIAADFQILKTQVRFVASSVDELRCLCAVSWAAAESLPLAQHTLTAQVCLTNLLPVARKLETVQTCSQVFASKLESYDAGSQTEVNRKDSYESGTGDAQQRPALIDERLHAAAAEVDDVRLQIRTMRNDTDKILQTFGEHMFVQFAYIHEAAALDHRTFTEEAVYTQDDWFQAYAYLIARLQKQLLRQNSEFMQIRHILAIESYQDVIPRIIELVNVQASDSACLAHQNINENRNCDLLCDKCIETDLKQGESTATQIESLPDAHVDKFALRSAVELIRTLLSESACFDELLAMENRLLVLYRRVYCVDIAVQNTFFKIQDSRVVKREGQEVEILKAYILQLKAQNSKLQAMFSKCSQQALRGPQADVAGLRAENSRLQHRCGELEEILAVYEQHGALVRNSGAENGLKADNQTLRQQNAVLERQIRALKGAGLSAKHVILLSDVVRYLKEIFRVESDAALVESAMRAVGQRASKGRSS